MFNTDAITGILVKLLRLDPLNIPSPIVLLGFLLTIVMATLLVASVWFTLKLSGSIIMDMIEIHGTKRRIVIARGLSRHDFDQIRNGIKAFRLLLVRYGSDAYLRYQADEGDRKIGRPRYNTLSMKLSLSNNGELTLKWNLPLHRRLGTQFRCYIDRNIKGTRAEDLIDMLRHYDEIEILESEVEEPRRIYFLLKRFPVITSAEGFRQNMVYPE